MGDSTSFRVAMALLTVVSPFNAVRAQHASDNPVASADDAFAVDWRAYFSQAGIPRADLNVTEPKYLLEVNRQFQETPFAGHRLHRRSRAAMREASAPHCNHAVARPGAPAARGTHCAGANTILSRQTTTPSGPLSSLPTRLVRWGLRNLPTRDRTSVRKS
jgi:predicted metalloendopeptidase